MLDLKQPFRLGNWVVIPGRLTLQDGAEERHLEPKAMEMLVFLAGQAGQTVSRDTLVREIWRGTYGSDEALSRIISILRSSLGDNSKEPHFIETVPKTGYRLKLAPEPIAVDEQATPVKHNTDLRWAAMLAMLGVIAMLIVLWPRPGEEQLVDIYTIAIIPFQDIGATGESEFLSVGLTNEITASLNRSPSLRIVARSSLDALTTSPDGPFIDYYLQGMVGVMGGRLNVYAEISSGENGMVVWSDTYQTPDLDYLGIQQNLSGSVVAAMNRELGIRIESPNQLQVDLVAYTHYLNGIFLSKLRGEEPLSASIEAFTEALALEPGFDEARVALAHARVLLPYYSQQDEASAFESAAADLALLSGQANAEAEAIRGFIAFRQWRWQAAEERFLRSLQLNPDSANTHVWYSQFLSAVGRLQESLQYAESAYELDAVSPVVNDRLATALLWLDRNEESARQFTAGANLGFSSFLNPSYLVLMWRNQDYEGIRQTLRALHPGVDLQPLISNLELLGEPEYEQQVVTILEQLIDEGRLIPRLEFGVWVVLQQWDRATATIEKYADNRKHIDVEFLFAAESEEFRSDPSFGRVTSFLGLDGYWAATDSGP